MLRHLTAILFFLAFAAQTFNSAVVVLDYYGNTAAYAQNCENKAKPAMQCKGKCQMMKKLQQEEEKNRQMPERKSENKVEILFASSFHSFEQVVIPASRSFLHAANSGKEVKRPRLLLRPPIA